MGGTSKADGHACWQKAKNSTAPNARRAVPPPPLAQPSVKLCNTVAVNLGSDPGSAVTLGIGLQVPSCTHCNKGLHGTSTAGSLSRWRCFLWQS
jgi:hypothetical protein